MKITPLKTILSLIVLLSLSTGTYYLLQPSSETRLTQAQSAYQEGNFDTALTFLNKINSRDNNLNYRAQLMKGNILRALKKPEEALAIFETLEKTAPNPSIIFELKALCYLDMKKASKADISLQKALREDPKNVVARNNLALLYIQFSKFKEAETLLLKNLEIQAYYPDTQKTWALMLEKQNKPQKAVFYWKQYLKLHPQAPDKKIIQQKIGPTKATDKPTETKNQLK